MTTRELERHLKSALSADHVEVADESAAHVGHLPAAPTEGTHLAVLVVSAVFHDKTQVERHRAVYAVLEREWQGSLHALRIRAVTPQEWRRV